MSRSLVVSHAKNLRYQALKSRVASQRIKQRLDVEIDVGTNPDSVTITMSGRLGRGNVSSRRYKHDIKPINQASEAIHRLRPVSFRYKAEVEPKRPVGFGLVAEEVEKINPDLVSRDRDGKPLSVRYDQVNAMLLNEFLKEHRKVEELEKQVEKLTAGLQKVSAQLAAASPSRGGL